MGLDAARLEWSDDAEEDGTLNICRYNQSPHLHLEDRFHLWLTAASDKNVVKLDREEIGDWSPPSTSLHIETHSCPAPATQELPTTPLPQGSVPQFGNLTRRTRRGIIEVH